MAKIIRKTGDVKAFGSSATGTNRTVFGAETQSDTLDDNVTTELLSGWQTVGANEKPTLQDFNAAGFTAGQYIAYLHQMGIAEWDGAQQYQINSFANRGGVIYRCKTADHTSATAPESDATNWEDILALKADLSGAAFTGQAKGITPVDDEDLTRKDFVLSAIAAAADTATINGSTVFTQSTNNIGLTGIGDITLAVGDVISVAGTSSNNKDFTVEVITDANNIIVNQSHAGGTTSKSLVNETISATINLVARANVASVGLGQGWVDVSSSRSANVNYTNATGRSFSVIISINTSTSNMTITVDSESIAGDLGTVNRQHVSFVVPKSKLYRINGPQTKWSELR